MHEANNAEPIRPAVKCSNCSNTVFDGLVIKARVVRLLPVGAEAKCSKCKSWEKVPITYSS